MTLHIMDDHGVWHCVESLHETGVRKLINTPPKQRDETSFYFDFVCNTETTVEYEALTFAESHEQPLTCLACIKGPCTHGIFFDDDNVIGWTCGQIRVMYPRLNGPCPKGCGFSGIYYASHAHFVMGDW